KRLPLEAPRLAGPALDEPDIESHSVLGVVVHELHPRARIAHLAAELLGALAAERLERALAGRALAARLLPEAFHVRPRPALIHEHAPVGILEDADEHMDLVRVERSRHGGSRAGRSTARAAASRAARGTACISCLSRTGTARCGRPCARRAHRARRARPR